MWFSTTEHIINGYRGFEKTYPIIKRGIFLDTAPLFVLICGHYDKQNNTHLIENFETKITLKDKNKCYKSYDYDYLKAFLKSLNKEIPLLITPYIFTEFIKHLWEIVDNPEQFKDILHKSFKSKKQIKDIINICFCNSFFDEMDFLDKKLEIGDISIIICAKNEKINNGAITILTDDETFALISDNKHGFITIYYPEIRNATILLRTENIPKEYIQED